MKSSVPPSVVPLTHVRTPEEVTGVKSPDPENWTVPIENRERLEWSGVNTSGKLLFRHFLSHIFSISMLLTIFISNFKLVINF